MVRFMPQFELMEYFYCNLAIIQVKADETNYEAWHRHIMETPEDFDVTIRVFNS